MTITIQDYFESNPSVVGVSHIGMLLDSVSANAVYLFKAGDDPTDGIRQFDITSGAENSVIDHDTLFGAADAREINDTNIPSVRTYDGKLLMVTQDFFNGSAEFDLINPASSYAVVDQWNTTGAGVLYALPDAPAFPQQMAPGSKSGVHMVAVSHNFSLTPNKFYIMEASPSLQFAGHAFTIDEARVLCGYTQDDLGKFYHTGHTPSSAANVGIYRTTFTASAAGYDNSTYPGTPNTHITTTKIGTFAITAIDAGWTSLNGVSQPGFHVDDGNLLLYAYGNGGSGSHYLIKVNATTAAVIWACPLNSTPTTLSVAFSAGIIRGSTFSYISGRTLYTINLTTGASSTQLLGTGGGFSVNECYYDYPSNSNYVEGLLQSFGSSPVPANSTTTHNTEQWYRIQLGPVPSPPIPASGGGRRFAAIMGPVSA